MGLFGSKNKKQEESNQTVQEKVVEKKPEPINQDIIKTPTNNVSVIKERFKLKATIEGEGSLIIGGILDGEVKIDDTLYIQKGARVTGIVQAKNVKIAGDFEGTVYSTAIEITKSGRLNGVINANKTFLGGFVNGVIRSIDSIEISESGIVDTKECKSKKIKIVGSLEGRVVASELLEVTSGGSVKGDIITKGIRTEQGGSIIGNIQTYDESIHGQEIDISNISEQDNTNIDPEVAKLIDINPNDIKKYAKKEDNKGIKRIPPDKK